MNTITLNMSMFQSNAGFTRRNTLFHILVAASREHVKTYSTCRPAKRGLTHVAAAVRVRLLPPCKLPPLCI